MKRELDACQLIERSIQKRFRKEIWTPFVTAVKRYELIRAGDRIAVCISGGKDSMLLAKLMQQLNRHSDAPFEAVYLVMDPGYNPENRRMIEKNAELTSQMRYLQRDGAALQLESAYAQAETAPDGKKIVCACFEGMDMAAMREAAGAIAEKYDCYVLCASQNESGAVLSFVRGTGCVAPMGKLLSETAKACGGKGGGRPDFAQGGGCMEILEAACRLLKEANV